MSRSSKSPRAVAVEALAVGSRALPPYSHKNSPKVYTQPQLFACLVLKAFFKTGYRGVAEILRDCRDLIDARGLKAVPHYTTLQKACDRLLRKAPANDLLTATVRRFMGGRRRVRRADGGVVNCYDAADGKLQWQQRLAGAGGVTASPVAAGGRVFVTSERGDTHALPAGRTFEPLHVNPPGERVLASPALAGGRWYVRTDRHLFCLGRPDQGNGTD